MLVRFAGFLAAVAIIFSLEYYLRVEWYVATPLGIFGYIIVRSAGRNAIRY